MEKIREISTNNNNETNGKDHRRRTSHVEECHEEVDKEAEMGGWEGCNKVKE